MAKYAKLYIHVRPFRLLIANLGKPLEKSVIWEVQERVKNFKTTQK